MPILKDMGAWNAKHGKEYYSSPYYKNQDAIENVVRYITRTRGREDRQNELIVIGGSGIRLGLNVECIIDDMLSVQRFYKIDERQGRRVMHYTYQFSEAEYYQMNKDFRLVNEVAKRISEYFYLNGYQNVYAIHHDPEKLVHIHIAINTINYKTGKKIQVRNYEEMKDVFNKYFFIVVVSQGGSVCLY